MLHREHRQSVQTGSSRHDVCSVVSAKEVEVVGTILEEGAGLMPVVKKITRQ